jgi:hypothetical protein
MGRISEYKSLGQLSQEVTQRIGSFAQELRTHDSVQRAGRGVMPIDLVPGVDAVINKRRIVSKRLTMLDEHANTPDMAVEGVYSTVHRPEYIEVTFTDEEKNPFFITMNNAGSTSVDGMILTPGPILRYLPLLLAERTKGKVQRTIGNRLYSGLAIARYIGEQTGKAYGMVPDYSRLDDMAFQVSLNFRDVALIPNVEEVILI